MGRPGQRNQFTVGRNHDCDVPIADDSVSRIHAEITIEADRLHVTDRDSRNGTRLIRDRKITPIQKALVLPTDQLQFGEAVLRVADLLDAIRRKHPQLVADAGTAEAEKLSSPKMVRCACGAIRAQSRPCPECCQ